VVTVTSRKEITQHTNSNKQKYTLSLSSLSVKPTSHQKNKSLPPSLSRVLPPMAQLLRRREGGGGGGGALFAIRNTRTCVRGGMEEEERGELRNTRTCANSLSRKLTRRSPNAIARRRLKPQVDGTPGGGGESCAPWSACLVMFFHALMLCVFAFALPVPCVQRPPMPAPAY